MPTLLQTWALPAALLVIVNISTTWYNVVSKYVPDSYLVSAHKRSAGNIALMSIRTSSSMCPRPNFIARVTTRGILKSQHHRVCE